MANRKIRVGAAALGRAFSLMLPTLALDERIELVAGADPRPEGRAQFEKDFGGTTYESVEQMCAEADIEAVYVSSPHQFHAANTLAAAQAGKPSAAASGSIRPGSSHGRNKARRSR